jgi:hypothetical protein
VSSALSFIGGSSFRRKSSACPKFDRVWPNRSPIPVGRMVFPRSKWFLPAFPRVQERGGGCNSKLAGPTIPYCSSSTVKIIWLVSGSGEEEQRAVRAVPRFSIAEGGGLPEGDRQGGAGRPQPPTRPHPLHLREQRRGRQPARHQKRTFFLGSSFE